jgi:hypothetical protein
MFEPSTPEARWTRDDIRGLLKTTAMQQAESSTSRHHGLPSERHAEPSQHEKEASVHPKPAPRGNKAPPVHERIIDNRRPRDARDDLNERRKRRSDDGASRGYHEHRGGCYDSTEDRSPSPEPPGPRVFSKTIRRTQLPARFCPPTTLTKYNGETKPKLWLADFRLACQLGGATDD